MKLRHPGLGHVQNLADFLEVDVVKIVEGNYDSLLFRQFLNQLTQKALQLTEIGHF